MGKLITFEIVLGNDKMTIRDTEEGMVTMLNNRNLVAVKRGYTTWVVYENGKRCGSVDEIG